MAKAPIAILCGGKGKRLRPRTLRIPKALVEVNGKPILEYILDRYLDNCYRDIILCTGYKSDLIETYCLQRYGKKLRLRISNAGENASMLERICQASRLVSDDLIVSYCDTLTALDLDLMLKTHKERQAMVTIATAKIQSPFGLVHYGPCGKVESFEEKPLQHYYIGHAVFAAEASKRISTALRKQKDGEGLVAFYQQLAQAQQLFAFEHKGFQVTFNTAGDLTEVENELKTFYTLREE